jgi:hypothetical protein
VPVTREPVSIEFAAALLRPYYGRATADGPFAALSFMAQWERLRELVAEQQPEVARRLGGWALHDVRAVLERLAAPPARELERLWSFRREVTCEAARRQEGGWELRVSRDGEMYLTELHPDRDTLLARANQLRLMMRAKGWRSPDPSGPDA